ncbi:hypothetical protein [Variovorax sp. UC122_21]|uniref:hypothetical protein n=1 Tax=Variovorax TaxID=34072 RepID=UPI0024794279
MRRLLSVTVVASNASLEVAEISVLRGTSVLVVGLKATTLGGVVSAAGAGAGAGAGNGGKAPPPPLPPPPQAESNVATQAMANVFFNTITPLFN